MSDIDHARKLLISAEKDLAAAEAMTDSVAFSDEIVGFHVQQAIEKSLKAWLAFLDVEYPKSHDIGLLLHTLEEKHVDVEQFDHLIEYSIFAVQYRYELYDQENDPLDRTDACSHAH